MARHRIVAVAADFIVLLRIIRCMCLKFDCNNVISGLICSSMILNLNVCECLKQSCVIEIMIMK